jgi:molecular chaperone DnaK (HSP70)
MQPNVPDANRPDAARFVVGIDLGTTNSAVAFVDARAADPARVSVFPIPQLVAPGEMEARDTLPSFHFEPAPGQFDEAALRLPWEKTGRPAGYVVGVLARERGADVPGRLVVSAKSWLSHAGVDRTAELLPWHGAPEVKKLSPVEVSARFLWHLRAAWDQRWPDDPLEAQEVVVTIPASFDEVARELTLAAARRAGLGRIALLEEPQAAFYAWAGRADAPELPRGAKVLVCDIGGGTSDFTLIESLGRDDGGAQPSLPAFRRYAVGDHLILGGDNLDLALARFVETRLGAPVSPRQWGALLRRCQQAKETLLGPDAPARLTLSVPAAGGSRLIGGARQVELERAEVAALLMDGFLPRVGLDAQPARRSSGFQEFGLPYAPDPAITRYLAAFLSAHAEEGGAIRPDAVLFNGGFFESPALREQLLEVLNSWFGGKAKGKGKTGKIPVLENERLDLAVALGAVRFGMARRGVGAKISGGLARSYYIGIGQEGEKGGAVALCLAPAGLEEGSDVDLKGRQFHLRLRQPVEFPLYVSGTRPADRPGDLVELNESLTALPPIRTALRGKSEGAEAARVHLHARLTDIGTLEVWCEEAEGGRRQWKLPFDVRAATPALGETPRAGAGEPTAFVDEQTADRCRALIREAFAASGGGAATLAEGLVKRLEAASGMGRLEWPPSLLRGFWEELMSVEPGRKRSPIHEARWLNLLGFSLRPGYGFAVDDWRAAQTWRLFERRVIHPRNELCRAEWHILWRRIAGGLTAGQQRTLAAPLLAEWRKAVGLPIAWGTHETAEIWRLLGSLEWLGADQKLELGHRLLGQWPGQGGQIGLARAAVWTLGRLGARAPMYGPLNTVLPADEAENWIHRLCASSSSGEDTAFALVQIARRTGDRFRDISEDARNRTLAWLAAAGASPRYVALVRDGGPLHAAEQDVMFGENLPCGLRLVG